jgi:hypothetical protein
MLPEFHDQKDVMHYVKLMLTVNHDGGPIEKDVLVYRNPRVFGGRKRYTRTMTLHDKEDDSDIALQKWGEP